VPRTSPHSAPAQGYSPTPTRTMETSSRQLLATGCPARRSLPESYTNRVRRPTRGPRHHSKPASVDPKRSLFSWIPQARGSKDQVWRVRRKHDLHLERRQSWCMHRSGVQGVSARNGKNAELGILSICCQYPILEPKISAFPVRRNELPAGSGKFLKNGVISVEFARFW
jgi:hypothetical protein